MIISISISYIKFIALSGDLTKSCRKFIYCIICKFLELLQLSMKTYYFELFCSKLHTFSTYRFICTNTVLMPIW